MVTVTVSMPDLVGGAFETNEGNEIVKLDDLDDPCRPVIGGGVMPPADEQGRARKADVSAAARVGPRRAAV
jgi:hypothetical protein